MDDRETHERKQLLEMVAKYQVALEQIHKSGCNGEAGDCAAIAAQALGIEHEECF